MITQPMTRMASTTMTMSAVMGVPLQQSPAKGAGKRSREQGGWFRRRFSARLDPSYGHVYGVYMDAKQRILRCALDELQSSGVEKFSLRAVGVAAGVTPMAVYRHYRDREALLAAAGEEAFSEWKARAGAIKATQPLDWLRQVGRAY